MNADVVANDEVNTIQTTKKEAETMGAVAFFGDKYGDRVRVVRAGRHSLEFCGGTHVERLGDIGQIQIVSESSIGSNTRRIEGVSAMGAYQRSHDMETALGSVAAILKSSVGDVVPALERIMERQRDFEKELSSLRQAQLSRFAEELHAQITSDVLVARVDGYPGEQLRSLAADLQRRGRRVVVLVGALEDKVSIAVASDDTLDATNTVEASWPLWSVAAAVARNAWRSPVARNATGIDAVLSAAAAL